MKEIHYKAIPHGEQRYDTAGDYFTDEKGVEQFRVSQLSDTKREHLVLIHELVERIICYHTGISNDVIDRFDFQFEASRQPDDESEPGDSYKAPYYRAHQIATMVERLLADELSVDFNDYEEELSRL